MRAAIRAMGDRRTLGSHPGLLLQKYLLAQGDPTERRALFDAVIASARSESLRAAYGQAFARREAWLPDTSPHKRAALASTGRLAVGLGTEGVLETGLRLHHTYGVPILPGSALKGLAAHYCHEVWGQRHDDSAGEESRRFRRKGDYHRLLFGDTEDGGAVVFHDAWITPPSLDEGAFHLDVMTPHHSKWQTNEAPPTDFDTPVPVSFLSVAGTFDLLLTWSGPAAMPREAANAWLSLALQLLQEAIAESGVGGKTSSGYGRLAQPTPRQVGSPPAPASRRSSAPVAVPRTGQSVQATLLEDRTKKGGWRARHEASGLSGPIQNSTEMPADSSAGDKVTLLVAAVETHGLAFRYPVPGASPGQGPASAGTSKPDSGRRPRKG